MSSCKPSKQLQAMSDRYFAFHQYAQSLVNRERESLRRQREIVNRGEIIEAEWKEISQTSRHHHSTTLQTQSIPSADCLARD